MGKRKKAKAKQPAAGTQGPSANATEGAGSESVVEWPQDGEAQASLLSAIKFHFLGPFLFQQKTLCSQAEQKAVDEDLLPSLEGVWPTFFPQGQWKTAVLLVHVVGTAIQLCENNQIFRDFLLNGQSTFLNDSKVGDLLKMHCKNLVEYTTSEIQVVYQVLQVQVSAVGGESSTHNFLQTQGEKEQLVKPIQDRGNSNFREKRYRAAIADYTRAIQICPFGAVPYCNRSLCYMKSEESQDVWKACLDSFRALVLRPNWEKAYYRCAEAWLMLGDKTVALRMNEWGHENCEKKEELTRQKAHITAPVLNGPRNLSAKGTVKTGATSKTTPTNGKATPSTEFMKSKQTEKSTKERKERKKGRGDGESVRKKETKKVKDGKRGGEVEKERVKRKERREREKEGGERKKREGEGEEKRQEQKGKTMRLTPDCVEKLAEVALKAMNLENKYTGKDVNRLLQEHGLMENVLSSPMTCMNLVSAPGFPKPVNAPSAPGTNGPFVENTSAMPIAFIKASPGIPVKTPSTAEKSSGTPTNGPSTKTKWVSPPGTTATERDEGSGNGTVKKSGNGNGVEKESGRGNDSEGTTKSLSESGGRGGDKKNIHWQPKIFLGI